MSYAPLAFGISYIIGKATGINGNSVADTTLFTVPAGKIFLFNKATIRIESIAGGGTSPTAKIKNATGPSDLTGTTTLVGLNILYQTFDLVRTSSVAVVGCEAGDVIQFSITGAGSFTTYTIGVYIEGALI